MANSTLSAIQQKVRRLTRSPGESQLTTTQLNEYINTFILYNFPSNLRLFNLRQLLTFYTQPNVDQYKTSTDTNDPLYNFKNKYIAVHPPVYLAGIQGFYTQWRDVFYGYYPQTNTIADTLQFGDGTTGPFTGTIEAHPVLQNSVVLTCLSTNDGNAMILVDYPISNISGALGPANNPGDLSMFPYGQIDYLTGDFQVIFPNTTLIGAPIISEVVAYQPGKPLAVLYYNDTFTIRPVPDKVYSIQFEVDVQPTELLESTDRPDLDQWWQYIAYGASKLVLEDRSEMDQVQLIMPEFKAQESMVLRTTLQQQANERTVTIYTQGKNMGFGWWGAGGWPY